MLNPLKRALAAAAFALPPLLAAAQPYPARPIRLVDPFPPGSVVDVIGRIVATQLQHAWGQPVIVDNRGGAGGTIGAQIVAQAPPDGYTLLITTSSTHAIAPAIRRQMPYDAVKDFTPIALPVRGTVVPLFHKLVVNRNPFRDGTYRVPDAPGWGVNLDPELVARYRVN